MKLDALFFAAHPDDVELGCAGSIIKMTSEGKKVGVIDLTQGELGSRGTPEGRLEEALEAGRLMGLSVRHNLSFRDGFFKDEEGHRIAILKMIRKYQPDVVIANSPEDRHPDHGRASKMVRDAAFLSGLHKIETSLDNEEQKPWRPKNIFYYIQDFYHQPDFVIDITGLWDQKVQAIQAFASQFFSDKNKRADGEPQTYISGQSFIRFLEGRARNIGHLAGYEMGEGYLCETPIGVPSLTDLDMGW